MTDDNVLQYDLSFLNVKNQWPPKGSTKRLDTYKFAQQQFELTNEDLIKKVIPDGLLLLKEYGEFAEVTKMLGYPRLLTLKTTDMVVGQPPIISVQAKNETTEKIKDVRNNCDLSKVLKQGLIDYSRFGVMLLRVFRDEKSKRAMITVWNPNEWTPVFYSDGTNRIRYNVIGWRYNNILTVQIHDTEDGSYEERKCSIDSKGIITEIQSSTTFNENSNYPLLYAIVNTPTSTNPLGTGDYEIINGLLQKAIQRLLAILRVLDEHADPSMTGPYSLLSKTESGEQVFKTSKYYGVSKDEPKPEYIVWKAELESSFVAFEKLCEQIYILSEMGEAFLGVPKGSSNVVSGTAMRFKLISPLEKARRIENEVAEPLKKIISTLLYIDDKIIVDAKDINIAWRDSLPKDPKEVAELAKSESGVVAIKPLLNSIMDNYELDEQTAQQYVDGIMADQKAFSEITNPNINPATGEDGRSHPASGKIDPRKNGSQLNPSSSENRGDDQNARLT